MTMLAERSGQDEALDQAVNVGSEGEPILQLILPEMPQRTIRVTLGYEKIYYGLNEPIVDPLSQYDGVDECVASRSRDTFEPRQYHPLNPFPLYDFAIDTFWERSCIRQSKVYPDIGSGMSRKAFDYAVWHFKDLSTDDERKAWLLGFSAAKFTEDFEESAWMNAHDAARIIGRLRAVGNAMITGMTMDEHGLDVAERYHGDMVSSGLFTDVASKRQRDSTYLAGMRQIIRFNMITFREGPQRLEEVIHASAEDLLEQLNYTQPYAGDIAAYADDEEYRPLHDRYVALRGQVLEMHDDILSSGDLLWQEVCRHHDEN